MTRSLLFGIGVAAWVAVPALAQNGSSTENSPVSSSGPPVRTSTQQQTGSANGGPTGPGSTIRSSGATGSGTALTGNAGRNDGTVPPSH